VFFMCVEVLVVVGLWICGVLDIEPDKRIFPGCDTTHSAVANSLNLAHSTLE
jgi:hypothetical protein